MNAGFFFTPRLLHSCRLTDWVRNVRLNRARALMVWRTACAIRSRNLSNIIIPFITDIMCKLLPEQKSELEFASDNHHQPSLSLSCIDIYDFRLRTRIHCSALVWSFGSHSKIYTQQISRHPKRLHCLKCISAIKRRRRRRDKKKSPMRLLYAGTQWKKTKRIQN